MAVRVQPINKCTFLASITFSLHLGSGNTLPELWLFPPGCTASSFCLQGCVLQSKPGCFTAVIDLYSYRPPVISRLLGFYLKKQFSVSTCYHRARPGASSLRLGGLCLKLQHQPTSLIHSISSVYFVLPKAYV